MSNDEWLDRHCDPFAGHEEHGHDHGHDPQECTCEAPWPCYHPDNVANGNTPCMGSGHMDDYSDEWWIEEDYQIWMPNQDMVNEWCLKNMGPEHVGCGQESIIGLPIEHQEQHEHDHEHKHELRHDHDHEHENEHDHELEHEHEHEYEMKSTWGTA